MHSAVVFLLSGDLIVVLEYKYIVAIPLANTSGSACKSFMDSFYVLIVIGNYNSIFHLLNYSINVLVLGQDENTKKINFLIACGCGEIPICLHCIGILEMMKIW